MKKNLTLEEKYLAVASEVEISSFVFGVTCEALMVLSKQGEKHAIADVFYLAQENEDKRIDQRKNAIDFYPNDFISSIRKLPVVQDIKNRYFENPEFLSADEYAIMAGMVADNKERDALYYRAAKNYLVGFRDYARDLDGAFFLKMLDRSAKLNDTSLEKSPVARDIKKVLLWGDEKKKEKLFSSLVYSVKKDIVKRTKNRNDSASKFARAFALKNENLTKNQMINKESFNIFRDLSDTDTIWALKIKNEDIVKREETGSWI